MVRDWQERRGTSRSFDLILWASGSSGPEWSGMEPRRDETGTYPSMLSTALGSLYVMPMYISQASDR